MGRPKVLAAMATVGALAGVLALPGQAAADTSPQATATAERGATRDPRLWPYAATSIWNMPIGSTARYVDAGIRSRTFGVDTDWFVVARRTDPKVPTYAPGSWGEGRCRGTTPQQQAQWHPEAARPQYVPRSLVIPDAVTHGGRYSTPNNSSAILQPDGKTLVSYNVTARCVSGGPLYGAWFGETSLLGNGIDGGHGGSGMSSIGGSLRTGELLGSAPIPHALKVDIWGRYLFHDAATGGRRWPARLADGGAAAQYQGKVRAVRMGALLALPPTTTARALGITTAVGRKLFAALQNYGAYVVDDSGYDTTYLCVEQQAQVEYRRRTGHALEDDRALQAEFGRIMNAVAVVDDNGPRSVGGHGARRAPLAPPMRAAPRALPSGSPSGTSSTGTSSSSSATAGPAGSAPSPTPSTELTAIALASARGSSAATGLTAPLVGAVAALAGALLLVAIRSRPSRGRGRGRRM